MRTIGTKSNSILFEKMPRKYRLLFFSWKVGHVKVEEMDQLVALERPHPGSKF
jgi:hypothetical protein